MLQQVIARAVLIFSACMVLVSSGLAQDAVPSPRSAGGDNAWIKIATVTAKASETSVTAQIAGNGVLYSAIRVEAENNAAIIKRVMVNPGGIAQTSSAPKLVVGLTSRGQSVASVTVSYTSQRDPSSTFTIIIYGLKSSGTLATAPRPTVQAARPTAAAPGPGERGVIRSAPVAKSAGGGPSIGASQPDGQGTGQSEPPQDNARHHRHSSGRPADTDTAESPGQPRNGTGRGGDASVSGGAAGEGAAASSGGSPGGAGHIPPPRGTTVPNATDRTVSGNVPVRPTVDQPSTSSPDPQPTAPTPTVPAPPRTVAATAETVTQNVCLDKKICTPVGIFFGTDREPAPTATRIAFNGERHEKLTLGHAFVTVPKVRTTGKIQLPTFWDIHVRGVPESGDPAQHFTIPPGGVSIYDSPESFIAEVKQHIANAGAFKDHAFVFIHGFYVSFDQALFRTAQIAYDLSPDGQPFGTAFLYSWPSAGNVSSYLKDEDSARLAASYLAKFLKLVIDQTGAKHIHLIAHSMGNVPLINALQKVATPENKGRINQIVLAAPDFDKKEFEDVVAAIAPIAEGITLYASSTDYAMKAARKARSDVPRAGDATMPPGPPIAKSFETIDVSALDSTIFSWGHDHYAESQVLLNDMSAMFRNAQHPPSLRNLNFKPQVTTAGTFWRYVK